MGRAGPGGGALDYTQHENEAQKSLEGAGRSAHCAHADASHCVDKEFAAP